MNKPPKNAHAAFTCIEILIVVIIVAILAVIAIPNLQESQTRSNVSRCVADLRRCVIALESYRVDNKALWGDTFEYMRWYNISAQRESGPAYRLTTPVAYMTKIPIDQFNIEANKIELSHNASYNAGYASFFERAAPEGPGSDGFIWMADGAPDGVFSPYTRYKYLLQSAGPDLRYWSSGSNGDFRYYDPTNGATSRGDIFYIDTLGYRGGGQF